MENFEDYIEQMRELSPSLVPIILEFQEDLLALKDKGYSFDQALLELYSNPKYLRLLKSFADEAGVDPGLILTQLQSVASSGFLVGVDGDRVQMRVVADEMSADVALALAADLVEAALSIKRDHLGAMKISTTKEGMIKIKYALPVSTHKFELPQVDQLIKSLQECRDRVMEDIEGQKH